MITGTKNIAIVPAAQRQARDRQQRRQQQHRQQNSDGEDAHREFQEATVIRIAGRSKPPADPPTGASEATDEAHRPPSGPQDSKRFRVDIRV